jgi:5-methylthioadenosine/S-adenosylhomocysteine deaminase
MGEILVGRFLDRPGRAPARRNVRLEIGAAGAGSMTAASARDSLAMPAPVNAHDHGYGIRTTDFGCVDDALEPWIAGMRLRPPTAPYLEALVAFGRLAANGCGATMHCHNSLRIDRLADEVAEVVRAARDCGIRLAVSCPLVDASPWVYGGPQELRRILSDTEWGDVAGLVPRYGPIEEQLAAADAVARTHSGGLVDVQYGPIGPQWCSNEMLEAIADASARNDRRIHMHLLESPRQRIWLDRRFPEGIVTFLDRIGFLSPRLAVAHGVQLRPDECELLAARGVIVVSNPSANLRLRSGIAPIPAFRAAGLKFALGLDGSGFDDDQDIWREMRLFRMLHGGRGIDPALEPAPLFDAVIANGAAVVNQPAGEDVVIVDYAAILAEAIFDDVDEADVLLTRMTGRYVTDLFVAGRQVVHAGRLTGFDYGEAVAELVAQARGALPALRQERARAKRLAGIIRRYYRETYA